MDENLTNIQKIALEGEIASLLSTSFHDADLKVRIYHLLKEVDDKIKPFVLQYIKKSTKLDEETIYKIYLETLSGKTPVWLWIEKVIADIKGLLNMTDLTSVNTSLSLDRKEEKKKIIESAFVRFVRSNILLSPSASKKLLDTVKMDEDLSFLHFSCFYLNDYYQEIKDSDFIKSEDVPEELMEHVFDIRDILCYNIESTPTEELLKNPLQKRTPINKEKIKTSKIKTSIKNKEGFKGEVIKIEGSISPDELSNFLSQKLTELFQCNDIDLNSQTHGTSEIKEKPQIQYVVQKVFNNTPIKTDIGTYDTEEEAVEFIKQMRKDYPELKATCDFIICKRRIK